MQKSASAFAAALVALVSAALSTAASAAGPLPERDLVTEPVDSGRRVELAHAPPKWAAAANDEGRVPGDVELAQLTMNLKRPAERQQAFDAFRREQQDPASPNYQRWLTPTEIGERFGPTRHDIDAVAAWLSSQGLEVESVSNARTRIRFKGSAERVAAAFATELRYYAAGAEKRIANAAPAAVPAALAGVVRSVEGLRTMRLRPARRAGPVVRSDSMQPAGTNCSGGECTHYVFPADFAKIYDLGPVYSQGLDGSGETIAIVSRERVYDADVRNFQQISGLAVKLPTTVVPPDGTDPGPPATTCSGTACSHPSDEVGDQGEATLDVQRAGSVAPGAAILVIASANASTSDGIVVGLDYAIDTDPVPAKILSVSYTSCEADNGRDVTESLDEFFTQASAEGISVFVASGDAGVAGCASLDAAPEPGEALTTNALCASGEVTCVGGTEYADKSNPSTYWSTTNGANYLSALGYIPEGAWNEPLDDGGDPQLAATGGGVSAYIAKPAWQTGTGVPGNAGRYTPDVSFNASTREGYFTCFAAQGGPCTVSGGSFSFIISGGTSASAPSMAGVAAILNQKAGSAQANLNPQLYALAADTSNGVFHDVTVATSGVAGCTRSTPSPCNNSTPGPSGLSGGLTGYQVGAGYDPATGLGSIDVAKLVAAWGSAGGALNLDQVGLTGPWYNPATSGQGLVLQIAPDLYGSGIGLLFGGWFTFDDSAPGGARWYTIQGQVRSADASATMPIYASEGGNFDAPPAVGVEEVGQATIGFSDCTHGTLDYAFDDGRSGSIPLSRLGANVSCLESGVGTTPGPALLSGGWYEPATSGQGFVFDVNPVQHSFFAAWYTYAPNGQSIGGGASQRWYTLQASYATGATSLNDVPIYLTAGGVFDDPAPVSTTPIGSADIVFHDCNSATLSYSFTGGDNAGAHGTIEISRLIAAPSGCEL